MAKEPGSTDRPEDEVGKTAQDAPIDGIARAVLDFVKATEPMKNHTRTAWGTSGRPESVAEHSWRLCLLALAVGPHLSGLDTKRLIELCIVHDLGETFEGDISAKLQDDSPEKSATERAAVSRLSSLLPAGDGSRLRTLWKEYDDAATPEARAAKALDKIETIIQHNQGRNPEDFDYDFNLGYGLPGTHGQEIISAIRTLVDLETRERAGRGSS